VNPSSFRGTGPPTVITASSGGIACILDRQLACAYSGRDFLTCQRCRFYLVPKEFEAQAISGGRMDETHRVATNRILNSKLISVVGHRRFEVGRAGDGQRHVKIRRLDE